MALKLIARAPVLEGDASRLEWAGPVEHTSCRGRSIRRTVAQWAVRRRRVQGRMSASIFLDPEFGKGGLP